MKIENLARPRTFFIWAIAIFALGKNAAAVLGPIPIYPPDEQKIGGGAIISVDETEIEKSAATTFLDFLATIPGVNLFNAHGNVPRIFLRGSNAGHTVLVVDGVKIHDVSSVLSAADLEMIELSDIARIDILKGPRATLYGSGALGGVIQITTKNQNGKNRVARLDLTRGSHQREKYALTVRAGTSDDFIRLSLSLDETDGISAKSDNLERDGRQKKSFALGIHHRIHPATTIEISTHNADDALEYDDCFGSDDCLNDRRLRRFGVKISHGFNENWRTDFQHHNIHQHKNINGWRVNYQTEDTTILNRLRLGGGRLDLGFSKITDTNEDTAGKITDRGIFAGWHKHFDDFDVDGGIRLIDNSFGEKAVYHLNIERALGGGKIFAGYATAFKAPSIYQRDYRSDKSRNLEAETAENFELGFEKKSRFGDLDFRAFQSRIDNLIEYKGVYPNDNYENSSEMLRISGLDSAWKIRHENFDFSLAHHFVNSRFSKTDKKPARRPQNTVAATFGIRHQKFYSRLQMVGKSSQADSQNRRLAGYTLFHWTGQYRLREDLKFHLKIHNLLDKNYQIEQGYNQPGRTISLTMSAEI